MKIRCFIAVDLPQSLRKEIQRLQQKLRIHKGVKWVEPDSIHLTLKFLGEVEEEGIEAIFQPMVQSLSGVSSFETTVRDLGAFPTPKNPRVIWIGVIDEDKKLEVIHQRREKALTKEGFDSESRRFTPHLTLGRVKQREKELISTLEGLKGCDLGDLEIKEISLFKSDLKPTGAVYTKLKTFTLP